MKYFTLLFTVVLLISSCSEETNDKGNHSDNKTVREDSVIQEKPVYPYDSKFNDLANFLSGVSGSDSSLYAELESSEIWKNYCTQLEQIWQKTNSKIPVMKEWSEEQLADANKSGGTLFYPFSGPDFLHADLFFPEYDTIIMIGLEPIGSYPDLLSLERDTLGLYLRDVRKSLNAILGLSFFRTVAMADDFRSNLDGTLPLILQFINRTGHELMYQEKVALLPDGSLSNDLSLKNDSTYYANRYYFRRKGGEKVRTLVYFAVNLQNTPYFSRGGLSAKGLETRTDLVAYLNQSNIRATYLKSASYLMHRPSFSIIRDIILNNSAYVLQDDSGIPVKDFDRAKWDLVFYGSYIKPISLFYERQQNDLKRIYEGDSIKVETLPFGIGYQYQKGTSNLMKAIKK